MTFPHRINEKEWVQALRSLLSACRVQVGRYRFTQPHPSASGIQSPWHSALHAVLWRWLDGEMAADELMSAAVRQVQDGPEAGMIPYRTDWRAEDAGDGSDVTTAPLLAYAALQVYNFSGDTNLTERLYPRLAAWHDWFERRRAEPSSALVAVAHPEEFILGSGAVNVNAIRAADLDAMARLAVDLGRREEAGRWQRRAQDVRNALQATSITEPEYRLTPALMTLLFGGGLSDEDAAGLATRIEASADERPFPWLTEPDNRVSMIDNWLIYLGLRRYGLNALASRVAERSFRLVEAHGFHEFYDPQTGAGSGAEGFCASGLAVDMLFREKKGRAPHPECIQEIG